MALPVDEGRYPDPLATVRSLPRAGAPLAEVIAALEARYDPALAEDWDAVGLVCGDPAEAVRSVLFAVDPTDAVVDEAIEAGVDLVVTHHPLLLTAVHGVPADDPKGRVVHRLIRAGIGLFVAHTNADRAADHGVNDALAAALGVGNTVPLESVGAPQTDTLVVFTPVEDSDRLVDALSAAGAGVIGDYTRCAWQTVGTGTFIPGDEGQARDRAERPPGAGARDPAGDGGAARRAGRRAARAARVAPLRGPRLRHLRELLHPEPGRSGPAGRAGAPGHAARVRRARRRRAAGHRGRHPGGRRPPTGWCAPSPCAAAAAAPSTTPRPRRAPTSCSPATSSTTPAVEAMETPGPAICEVAHYASEWPWLPVAADVLHRDLGGRVDVAVSRRRTDPWTLHVPQRSEQVADPGVQRGVRAAGDRSEHTQA